jgi:hypothetical protein
MNLKKYPHFMTFASGSDVNEWRKKFPIVREFVLSDDGEKISAIVEIENKRVTPA